MKKKNPIASTLRQTKYKQRIVKPKRGKGSFKRKSKTSIYDIPYYITDNKKIKKTYKWAPKKNMDEIVKDTYNWLSKNKIQLSKFF